MATIKFYANNLNVEGSPILIPNETGSGIGFYGPGYGTSVPINGNQDTTWLTNSDGTAIEQVQINNTKYANSSQVSVNGAAAINLANLPNKQAPLEIRFTHDSAVRVQNTKLRIFDRNSIANHASGVSTYVYEVRHPSLSQNVLNLDHRARSSNTWVEFDPSEPGDVEDMPLSSSPGTNGLNGGLNDNAGFGVSVFEGVNHDSLSHSWFLALSIQPHEIGSKLFGLYFSTEYL